MTDTRLSHDAPILAIDGLHKSFGPVTAVDHVSLDIRRNEFFALLGPSGCGKTTLLRMLAGFETPSGGRILLEGKDISALPPEKRPLNLMFQSYALFPHMTVARNLAYGLEMDRLPKAEIARRVEEIMAVTDLGQFAARKPDQLSGGQKQRVALARALVKRPKVLLLDEPLGALDKKLRERMQLELKRLQHEVGITFIIVTHDQEEALVMADRMAILKDGQLLQCGSPEEVYERPADRFVANFIGVMNFIDGVVASDGSFNAVGLNLAVSTEIHGIATLAVRPENIRVTTAGAGIEGRVVDMAYHGLDRVLHVRIAASETPLQVRVPANAAVPHTAGDTIYIAIDPDRIRLFKA
ncbi:spermidine/putrescine ABC transporter ATP-binding subunit [Peteryoungia aggregata LMG 23059]|uniref:Spermidine/putrescine import ATP-binding protein PotA n=1 Tax=Peteryoungia aggregata LMG 23059 TaxID=1368425 RepID=A0ABU0G2L5_9HYPH|nr:ABC transporter ATP-binding protein [Peteryoungia aggregata]MDQ0419567.1 spermidine/putrescine ABC transporter ATP-binding subunit [Peteryoungia aggregata LMG 23059]